MVHVRRFGCIILSLFILAVILLAAACTPRAERKRIRTKDISLAKVLLKKELVVGLELDIPPLTFRNIFSGQLDGYEIEVAKEVGKYLDIKVTFKAIDWNQKNQLLKTGQIDCIWSSFSYTKDRAAAYTLSRPYMKTAIVIATMKDSPYSTLNEIKRRRIGIQSASSMVDSLDEMRRFHGGFNTPIFFDSLEQGLQDLEDGKIDGILYDVLIINAFIQSFNKPYKIIGEAVEADDYVIAFRKNDTALRDKVDEAIDYLAKNDILEKLSRKWFGGDVSVIRR